MKKLKFFGKFFFIVNSLVAFLLLVSYLLPYVPPKSFVTLSVLSLCVPLLILLNVLFFIYWLLQVKKQMLLSLFVLLIGYNYIGSFYKFSSSKTVEQKGDFSIMSFNARSFNIYKWLPSLTIKADIEDFIRQESPSIICLQEYRRGDPLRLEGYSSFNARYTKNTKGGQAIFSKFPIVNSGSLEFLNSNNNAIYIDIIKENDTIRIYNLHLQSAGINTDVNKLKEEKSSDLFRQVSSTFKTQQDQVELFLEHKSKCKYKIIVTGDLNNTAYSYVYKEIMGDDLTDTFEEAGHSFGKTFDFKFFPLRIDFILSDKDFSVHRFKTYNHIRLSDHYPIEATLSLD